MYSTRSHKEKEKVQMIGLEHSKQDHKGNPGQMVLIKAVARSLLWTGAGGSPAGKCVSYKIYIDI